MGFFNKKNDNEEILIVLGEIRDNLRLNNDDIVTKLESKIADAHYSNDEEIGVMATKINKLESIVDKQAEQLVEYRRLLSEYAEKLIEVTNLIPDKPPVKINTDEPTDFNKLFKEKYWNHASRSYTKHGVKYDGFNFKIRIGRTHDTIIINILQLKKLNDNLDNVIKDITRNNNFNFYAKKYDVCKERWYIKRVLFTLLEKADVFTEPLAELKQQHLYLIKGGLLYIDGVKSGLKVDDVIYIKSCLENSTDKIETIKNFMGYFNEIDNEIIRIISCNIEKIPPQWLQVETRVRAENDTKGRF